jgi:hypothetical protein
VSFATLSDLYDLLEPDAQRVLLHVSNVDSMEKLGEVWPHRDGYRKALLELVAQRLVMGRAQYGDLDLATDMRNFLNEAQEEEADMLIYYACAALQAGGK